MKDFGESIISIQACVIKKFLQGFMAPKQKKKRKQGGEESSKSEEFDEEKRLAEEARVRWHSGVRLRCGASKQPDLEASFSGGDGGRKLEDGHPRGSDFFAHARPAGDAGCQYKMGHVC